MLTLRDAARATGLSVKAIRRRVERGSLPHELIDGHRRVPMSALLQQGLLVSQASDRTPRAPDATQGVTKRITELESRIATLESRIAELEGPAESEPVAVS